jgi:TPR repeat protein
MAQEPALPVGAAKKSGETSPAGPPGPQANDPPAGASLDVAERSTEPPQPESIASPEIPADQKPSSTLLRAQQFLQGKGVQQNCEQGLVYLRAAAQKNEPAAAVQMGALYASGHCVQQDKVMAYRWFNAAHELQPANQWIQRNLNQLWSEMSDQEHRLAAY